MIAQGKWLTVAGVIFGGIWVWVAYWGWKNRRLVQTVDYLSRIRAKMESANFCLRSLAEGGINDCRGD
ncbi:hypothetical protein FD724_06870 [Nostoc sp. C057]|uniref:hypothetical protein n=1 Tax=Nostoc sp. C057 TaxID=2576903 RepID=UPI0015C385C8|nr:hypothetical protein [Nostoc sp. C057]QLE47860.1 hypothetical protein FD724_06870 [Nostoc sp. C057]